MKKKLFSLFLVLYLVFSNTTYVYAEAATIAITGGTVAAGGLTGVVGGAALAPYAVPIIGGALLGYGINVELTKQSQAAGMTKTQFIQSKVQQYANAIGTGVDAIYQNVLENASVAKNGVIYLGQKSKEQIWQLGNWLFDNNQVIHNTQDGEGESGTVTVMGVNYPYSDSITFNYGGRYTIVKISVPCALVKLSDGSLGIFNKADNNFTAKFYSGTSISGTPYLDLGTGVSNGYMYTSIANSEIKYGTSDITLPVSKLNMMSLINSLDGTWNPTIDSPAVDNDSFVGNADPWSSGQNALNPSNDYPVVLNPGLTGSLDLPQTGAYDIPVDGYIGALGDVINGVLDVVMPAINIRTGEKENLRVNDDTLDPTIDTPDNPDIPSDNTPVINPDIPADPLLTSSDMNVQFKGVFPFCIPFDVKDMIGLLNAEPEAPSYHVRWYIPFADTYLDFNVDLSGWDSTAAICRQMELLLFCLGLAFVTRSMFIRG